MGHYRFKGENFGLLKRNPRKHASLCCIFTEKTNQAAVNHFFRNEDAWREGGRSMPEHVQKETEINWWTLENN